MKIIGVTGNKRSGKDTLVEYFAANISSLQSIAQYSFADPIYDMLVVLLGSRMRLDADGDYDKDTVISPYGKNLRTMLQTLGTEWGRDFINPDIWVLKAVEVLAEFRQAGMDYVIFPDVRFNNEAEFIKKEGGEIVKVLRTSDSGLEDTHRSEEGISDSYVTDVVYNNKSLVDFRKQVSDWMTRRGFNVYGSS